MFPANQGIQQRPSGAVGPASQENHHPQPYNTGVGPPQLSPLPVDNRALPHDDPFLIHGQPNSGLNALHQFNNNSNGTPYYGHNPRLPFSYSDSSLRAQSAAPRVGGTPHGGSTNKVTVMVLTNLQDLMLRLRGCLQMSNASNQQLENSNQQLVESNQQLTMHVEAIELLQTESKNTGKKKAGSKNVSNEHSISLSLLYTHCSAIFATLNEQ
jgi:hypothetical protein